MMETDILKELKKDWWDENMSHGAFALTQDEVDYYMSLFKFKPKKENGKERGKI